jgi:streptogramin lyase
VAPAWFTQRGFDRDAADGIGRLTTEGRYTSWPLPRRRAAPLRIVPGPDGALWFTEQDAHAIGRITTDGQITEGNHGRFQDARAASRATSGAMPRRSGASS